MKPFVAIFLLLFLFTSSIYADHHSNQSEDSLNEAETDAAEEDSKDNDFFCDYSKAC